MRSLALLCLLPAALGKATPTPNPVLSTLITSKAVPAWSGSAADGVAGSIVGVTSGFVVGKVIRATLSSIFIGTVALTPTVVRASLLGSIIRLCERNGLLTIVTPAATHTLQSLSLAAFSRVFAPRCVQHWARIMAPFQRLRRAACGTVDQDGDGDVDAGDLGRVFARIFPEGSVQGGAARKVFSALDKDEDGKLDIDDVKLHAASNQHAAAGFAAGFTGGLAKGLLSNGRPKKARPLPLIKAQPIEVPALELPAVDSGGVNEWRERLQKALKVGRGAVAGARAGAVGAMK